LSASLWSGRRCVAWVSRPGRCFEREQLGSGPDRSLVKGKWVLRGLETSGQERDNLAPRRRLRERRGAGVSGTRPKSGDGASRTSARAGARREQRLVRSALLFEAHSLVAAGGLATARGRAGGIEAAHSGLSGRPCLARRVCRVGPDRLEAASRVCLREGLFRSRSKVRASRWVHLRRVVALPPKPLVVRAAGCARRWLLLFSRSRAPSTQWSASSALGSLVVQLCPAGSWWLLLSTVEGPELKAVCVLMVFPRWWCERGRRRHAGVRESSLSRSEAVRPSVWVARTQRLVAAHGGAATAFVDAWGTISDPIG